VARPSDAFEAALDSLDPEERAAFVAAVYAARGWESDRTGVVVLVRPPDDASDGRRVVPPGVEAPDDGTELDPDEFREMVLMERRVHTLALAVRDRAGFDAVFVSPLFGEGHFAFGLDCPRFTVRDGFVE
jgi:hypothetical protein